MSVNPMKWKTKNIVGVIIIILIFYFIFIHKESNRAKIEEVIKNTHPINVWEFVADFSNMKLLNPLIEDFNIVSESGNYEHWQYSVEYTEHLRYIPIIRNYGRGHYSIKQEDGHYVIYSNHVTCFFGFICLKSTSEFRFEKHGEKDTKCVESVEYQCPIVTRRMCHEEVSAQRKEIMERLKAAFSS